MSVEMIKINDYFKSSKAKVFMTSLIDQARQYIPGGVNSPVRAFNGVGGDPIFLEKGDFGYIYIINVYFFCFLSYNSPPHLFCPICIFTGQHR